MAIWTKDVRDLTDEELFNEIWSNIRRQEWEDPGLNNLRAEFTRRLGQRSKAIEIAREAEEVIGEALEVGGPMALDALHDICVALGDEGGS